MDKEESMVEYIIAERNFFKINLYLFNIVAEDLVLFQHIINHAQNAEEKEKVF